jgi:HK97 family phage major capsid protein
MALRALMLNKQLNTAKKSLEEARSKITELETREAELEKAIAEAETVEERSAVEEAVESFEAEKAEAQSKVENLEAEVENLEKELRESQTEEAKEEVERTAEPQTIKRKKEIHIMKRWKEMGYEERDAFVKTDEMQAFLGEVRSAIKEKRAISNIGYLIPENFLGLLRQTVDDYASLVGAVDKRSIKGTGRLVIEGAIPEAVWTEACANLNELDLGFSQVEVDGYKVGGYFKVCNANLEDSDIALASELITTLGQAIAFALDKAILFGTGTKMPVGVVTALKAVSGTPNVVSHAATVAGKDLIDALIEDAMLISSTYSKGALTWTMNSKTYLKIKMAMLNVNANGLYVAGDELPIIGGKVITLDFIPDDIIIGGHFDLYLLAERAGVEISTSEHAFWVADQTGLKGTARYDGKVLKNDAFVAIGINGKDGDDMVVTFPQDSANANG